MRCEVEEEEGRGCLAWVLDVSLVEREEMDVWIRLWLVSKINEGYFREANFILSSHGLFIKYLCNTPKYTLAVFDMFQVFCKHNLNAS